MSRRVPLWLAVGMALLAVAFATGCAAQPESPATPEPQSQPPAEEQPAPSEAPVGEADVTELKIEDLTPGTGAEAKKGDAVTVHYTGWLTDGTKFDSSVDSGQPFTFVIGQGDVITGWDEGVAGMKVGGKRKLVIPPQMGYGAQGAGGVIPPNATLVFEIELLEVN